MTDEHDKPEQPESEQAGETRRLDKAIQDMETGDIHEGTLVDIVAHTGEHAKPPEPSVTDALKQVKKGQGPDLQPAATMYEPTRPGHVSGGSTQQTVFGPTGAGGATPQSGTMNAPSGARPIAPFGGKIVVGTRVGQIEVTGVLGKGGMGEVFKGYHHALDINVAIKVLPDELSRNELVRQRFLREARLCVKLDHPHIVRVYNVDEYAGNLYLVMEMIEGTDSAHMLKNGGRFRYKRALEIGAACADALAYAHTQGLVHRDVKPHNILLGASDGKIKLSDFGLARAATSSSHLTMSGQIMGTPHYMSPEQAEAKEVTDKSDVYSLGVTVYHMLTGETPFVGDTPISVAVQHIAKEIIYPEIRFKPFPKELVAVLKRMTAKDPAKRCSAKQAAVWLRKLIAMAPEEDIAAGDDQAMKSMAPVVRESQAFEAAAKERQQRDQHARELAQTMLATIQEESGRRAQVQPTMQESAPQYTTQAPDRKGSGGLVAALVLIIGLMGGGGFAGWYFTLGPGAQKANNAPIIAGGDNRENTPPPANENRAPDNAPPANNGSNSAGNTTANNTPANNAPDNTPPDDGGELPPPEATDDPAIASLLSGAMVKITEAEKLEDLEDVRKKLERASMDINRGKGSAKQREEYKDLWIRYEQQRAYLASTESFARIRDALASYAEKRGSDRAAAIGFLNTAIKERDALAKLEISAEAEALVATDREALFEKVNSALNELWTELDGEAAQLEGKKQYSEALNILNELARINHSPEKLEEVSARKQVVGILDIHKTVRADLQTKQFQDAIEQLGKAAALGIPDSLKAEHDSLVAAVGQAIEDALDAHLKAAVAAADKGDFNAAYNERDAALAVPGKSNDQKFRVADVDFYIQLSEQVAAAEKSVAAARFNESAAALDKGDALVAGAGERAVPAGLQSRLTQARADHDRDLAKRFEELLAAAEAAMKSNDFAAAGRYLNEANDLPLSPKQKERLETFRQANQEALSGFVRGLIEEIEKALDANNFEAARDNLDATDSLPIPDDMQEKLNELRARFAKEALKRHGELLEAARNALAGRDYDAVRTALDNAREIPVAKEESDKVTELENEYIKLLTADVSSHLETADKFTTDGKYAEARTELDKAAALRLEGDLDRRYKNALERWSKTVSDKLAELLKAARQAADDELFSAAEGYIEEAAGLPRSSETDIEISITRDYLKAGLAKYKDKLFKQLEDAAKKGQEKEGLRLIELLKRQSLDEGEKIRLERARETLTGESGTQRYNRLPSHLKKIWDDRHCKPEQLISVGEEISAVAVSNDGKYGAAGTASGKIFFYNLKRGTQLGTSKGGTRRITAMAISPDGKYAACGNDDGNLVLFDLSGNSPQAFDLGGIGDDVFGLAFTSNSNVLFAAARDAQVTRFNPRTRAKLGAFATGLDRAQCMELSPNDAWLAVGGDDGRVALFDANRLVLQKTLDAPGDDLIQRVAFSADSKQLMAGSIGDGVGIWDLGQINEKPIKECKGLSEWIRGVGFSPDGRRCAGFDNEEKLVVWDMRSTAKPVRELPFKDKLKGQKDFAPSAGVIGPDGTVLIGTSQGELLHMTVKPAG